MVAPTPTPTPIPRPKLALVLALVVALGSVSAATPVMAQHSWRPDERVMISAFNEVAALTLENRRVFIATANGLTIYDRMSQRWELPHTAEDGYPAWERPSAIAHQRFGDILWLGTEAGTLFRMDLTFGRWESVASPAQGPIIDLVTVDDLRDDALYIRSTRGWMRLQSGSLFADPIAPGDLPAAVRNSEAAIRDPAFQAMRGTLTMDEHGRHWPFTDYAYDERTDEVWLGSAGGNVVRADPRMLRSERLVYGTVATGTSALAFDGTSLWFGGDGRGTRRGVSVADASLQQWTHYESFQGAPAGRVDVIVADDEGAWIGATDGLHHFTRESGRWGRLTDANGLPSSSVTSILKYATGVWVGTTRGLAFVGDQDAPAVFSRQGVHGLVIASDTLWVASDAGLYSLPLHADSAHALALTGLSGRVTGVAMAFGALHAIGERGIYRRSAAGWEGPIREPAASGVGRLRRIVGTADALWVSGADGVARAEYARDPSLQTWTVYRAPDDVPQGPVYDVLPLGDHVWVGTPLGALRLDVSR